MVASALMAPKDRFVNFDAVALSPSIGTWVFVALVALAFFFYANREAFRRIVLRSEDPRSVAVFRIVFGTFTLCNVNGLWEHFEYLFTDEGIFSTDVAQQLRAKDQFAGFGDGMTPGEVTGFFGFDGFLEWLKGPNYSLLLFDSSPTFFWIHLFFFEVAMVMFIVGFQTRWVKWVAWFLFHSIILRNTLYWEGTENVYRAFFFYLCLSRCGHAFSVDNWLRTRKLRKQGMLSEPGGPGDGRGLPPSEEHPKGLAAVYRLIPAWPRMLMILQTTAIYTTAGATKTGPVWKKGDSFYYAFNLDHFYRMPPQEVSSWFATTLFRLNSHVVHYWQMFFGLTVLGLVLRFVMKAKLPEPPLRRRMISWASLVVFGAALVGMVLTAYPVHYKPEKGQASLATVQLTIALVAPSVLLVLTYLYYRLRHKPFTVRLAGRSATLDLDWVCRWLFGRRLWLGLGTIFHVHLIVMMNIGWFNPGLFSTYLIFFNGRELVHLGRSFGTVLGRLGFKRAGRWGERAVIQAERPDLPHHHRDGFRVKRGAILTAMSLAMLGVLRQVETDQDIWNRVGPYLEGKLRTELPDGLLAQTPEAHWGWFGLCILAFMLTLVVRHTRSNRTFDSRYGPAIVALVWAASLLHELSLLHMKWAVVVTVGVTLAATRHENTQDAEAHPPAPGSAPWAYGPVGRLLAGGIFFFHVAGVLAWLVPDKGSTATWRNDTKEAFETWIKTTQTTQGWSMFAPNPPRSNLFMRVLVHDQNGKVWDLDTDVYACFEEGASPETCDRVHPLPWIWYSRQGKMNRRIVGGEGGRGAWYAKWHARHICREWALSHDGEPPEKVELVKVTYRLPSPEEVEKKGPYDPVTQYRKTNKQTSVHTTHCETSPYGQLSNEVRRRHGLPEVPEGEVRVWDKRRCEGWSKRLRDEALERGETFEDDDPRFLSCMEEQG